MNWFASPITASSYETVTRLPYRGKEWVTALAVLLHGGFAWQGKEMLLRMERTTTSLTWGWWSTKGRAATVGDPRIPALLFLAHLNNIKDSSVSSNDPSDQCIPPRGAALFAVAMLAEWSAELSGSPAIAALITWASWEPYKSASSAMTLLTRWHW